MSVVGFDFGTENCVICQAKRGGIDTVLNENSKRMSTNVVSFQGKERFLGEKAVPLMRSNYKNTVVEVKRFLGKKFSEPQVQRDIKRLPNSAYVEQLDDDRIGFKVNYNDTTMVLTPEDCAAMMLGQLKRTAEKGNGGKAVADCVISVPAYFTDRQRHALLDAAKIAKLNTLRLINDNTATALAYGIWKSARNMFHEKDPQYVMFVDIGASSYQVSIASFVQGKLEVVATTWDENFGGRDVDDAIVNYFCDEFKAKYKLDPRDDPKALIKMRGVCEKAKITLTPEGVSMANVNVEFLMNDLDFSSKLTIEVFNELVSGLATRISGPLEECLKKANLTADQLSAVEIIGGASRPRFVKKIVSETLKLDSSKPNYGLSTTLNADESVARGCALNCAMLSPAFRVKEFAVVDCVSYPVRISWEQKGQSVAMDDEETEAAGDGVTELVLFQQGDVMPKTRRVTFMRDEPFDVVAEYDQSAVPMLPEGTDTSIGTFTIKGMPKTEDSVPRIRVNFRVNIDGVFAVESSQHMEEIKDEPAPAAEEGKEGTEGKQGDAAAADTTAEGEGKAEEDSKKKKKKYKKFELTVESKLNALSDTELLNATQREEQFSEQDRILQETGEARNALEEYIYRMRDSMDGELKEFGSEEERNTLSKDLEAAESWLYDEGSDETKAKYVERLQALRTIGDKFQARKSETENRTDVVKEFRVRLETMLRVANSTDEKYSHIEEAERETVRKTCADAQAWLDEKLGEIGNSPLHVDPVVTNQMILDKVAFAETIGKPIVTKKKPPPPEPEVVAPAADAAAAPDAEMKGEDEANKDTAEDSKEDAPENMELD